MAMMRVKLHSRRASERVRVTHGPRDYLVSFSRESLDGGKTWAGPIREVFVDPPATWDAGIVDMMRDAAIVISIALQHGAPLERLAAGLAGDGSAGEPASPIGAVLQALIREG